MHLNAVIFIHFKIRSSFTELNVHISYSKNTLEYLLGALTQTPFYTCTKSPHGHVPLYNLPEIQKSTYNNIFKFKLK